jgi:hypothetical protein
MSNWCGQIKEVCKYPEGRLYGVSNTPIPSYSSLQNDLSTLRAALEEIIKLETTPIDETERSQEWRSVGWADAAEIAHKALRK